MLAPYDKERRCHCADEAATFCRRLRESSFIVVWLFTEFDPGNHAPQEIALLFDHLVGAGEKHGRHGKAERMGSLEIEHEFEA